MRHLIVALVLCCGLPPVRAQEPVPSPTPDPSLRPAETPSDILSDVLWRIAVASHLRIGFESAHETRLGTKLSQTPSLGDWTLKQALDTAVAADDRYEWRAMDDTIVVRPKRAWTDAADPLNRPLSNLQITEAPPSAVLLGLRDFVYTNRFDVSRARKGALGGVYPHAVSLHVDSGTVLDVLNRLTLASDQVMWLASYRGSNGQGSDSGWGLTFELRNAQHVTGASASRPLVTAVR